MHIGDPTISQRALNPPATRGAVGFAVRSTHLIGMNTIVFSKSGSSARIGFGNVIALP